MDEKFSLISSSISTWGDNYNRTGHSAETSCCAIVCSYLYCMVVAASVAPDRINVLHAATYTGLSRALPRAIVSNRLRLLSPGMMRCSLRAS